jgi:hypothetical protein
MPPASNSYFEVLIHSVMMFEGFWEDEALMKELPALQREN